MIEYRLQFEQLIVMESKNVCKFLGADSIKIQFRDHLGRKHFVFGFGNSETPLVKFHSIREDLELLENENLFNSLMESIVRLREQGGYLIFYGHKIIGILKV